MSQFAPKQAHGKPTVSVIMLAYNEERRIEQAILSIQAQTVGDWELIVVNDCPIGQVRGAEATE